MNGDCNIGEYRMRTAREDELESVFRFRYEHFFHCFDDGYPGLDRAKGILFEPHDPKSIHFCAFDAGGDLCAVSTATPASAAEAPASWQEWFNLEDLERLCPDGIIISTRMVVHTERRNNGLFDLFYRFIMERYFEAGYSLAAHYCSPGLICRYERLGHRLYGPAFTMPPGLLRVPMFIDLNDSGHLQALNSPIAGLCAVRTDGQHASSRKALLPSGSMLPNFRLFSPEERLLYVLSRIATDRPVPQIDLKPVLEYASALNLRAGLSHKSPPVGGFLCLVLKGAIQEYGSEITAGPGDFVGTDMLFAPNAQSPPFTVLVDTEVLVFDRHITRIVSSSGLNPIELSPWVALSEACNRSLFATGLSPGH